LEKSINEEDNMNILNNLEQDEQEVEEEDPEELIRRQEEMLEEFLDQALYESQAEQTENQE